MFKLSIGAIVVAGLLAATPSFADSKDGSGGTGRGCTLDPFNHTMRCIDFDHCTTDRNGNKVCPTTTTPTRAMVADTSKSKGKGKGKGKGETQDYLVVTLHEASIVEL